MVKQYFKKTTYSYSKRGKYYTNRHVTNLIRNWGKYKLTSSWYLMHVYTNEQHVYQMLGLDQSNTPMVSSDPLGVALKRCKFFPELKNEWTFWKCTGVLFEVEPISSNDDPLLVNGSVAFGLATEKINLAQDQAYGKTIESDKSFIVDIKNAQRKYFPIRTTNYIMFDGNDYVPQVPYYVAIGYRYFGAIQNNSVFPMWVVKITFYITCKDKIL